MSAPASFSRSVLVTGAAVRLGREVALAFAREGWTVVLHGHRSVDALHATASEVRALGATVHVLTADLADDAQVDALLPQAMDLIGRPLNALVNNASLFEPDSALTCTPAGLQRQMQVNAFTPIRLANALAAQRQGCNEPGVAIHVLDQKVHNLNPDYFSYTLSKLTLAQAVALQAQALAPTLRVCGVSPGLMYTSGPQTAANFAAAQRVNLLQRGTAATDVARAIVHLASNPAITGVTVPVDSGQHHVGLQRDVMFMFDEQGRPA